MVAPKKFKEEVVKKLASQPSVVAPDTCPCGAPVAKELGQNSVCAKHIKAG